MRQLDLKPSARIQIEQSVRAMPATRAEQRFMELCPAPRTDAEEYELRRLIESSDKLAYWRYCYLKERYLLVDDVQEFLVLTARLKLPAPTWEHFDLNANEWKPGRGK